MSDWIYIDLNGKPFARVRSTHSRTAAQLRITIFETCILPLPFNTYFIDNNGYHVAKEDEGIGTIEALLNTNNTVTVEYDELISEPKTSSNTCHKQKERKQYTGKFIISELFSILGWLWYLVLKPMTTLILTCVLIYYGYTKLVCHHGRFLPLITMYCPIDQLESISIPPVSELAENSASLADALMNADVNAPMRFVQAKASLIQLRSQVIYSDIDAGVKEKLSEQMGELQQLTQTGADQLTIMLTSFSGTMNRVRIYTQYALEDLSKVIHKGIHKNNNPLQLGYSEMEATNMLTKSFETYMTSVADETDKILFKAQKAHMLLEMIKNKLETIQELSFKGKYITQSRIDELQHGTFWSWLFGEGKLGIVKNERNLKTLDGFINFVTTALNNVNDVIIKLKMFKVDAEDLKQTIVLHEELPQISINRHAQLLQAALKRLTESKEKFEAKLQKANEPNELD